MRVTDREIVQPFLDPCILRYWEISFVAVYIKRTAMYAAYADPVVACRTGGFGFANKLDFNADRHDCSRFSLLLGCLPRRLSF